MNMAIPDNAAIIQNNVRQLAEEIRERDLSTEFDALRKLPEDDVEKLRSAGESRMNMPKAWGGPELTPMQQVEVIETLSLCLG